MSDTIFTLDRYLIRRKILKLFGGAFHVYDGDTVVGYSQLKAFRLKEDIRVYSDESMREELLNIKARSIIDFSAAYDIVDSRDGSKVGAARRRGFSSLVRDTWELLDPNGTPVGQLREDSTGLALLRRFLSNLVPQSFHLEYGNEEPVVFKQRFNPFVYKLEVEIPPGSTVDRRLVFGAAVLISAIEGRQE